MMKMHRKMLAIAAVALVGIAVQPVEASHFRGGAMIPSVSASGLLTIQATSFWRPTAVNQISSVSVGGVGSMNLISSIPTDTSATVHFNRAALGLEVEQDVVGPETLTRRRCIRRDSLRPCATDVDEFELEAVLEQLHQRGIGEPSAVGVVANERAQ